MSVSRERLQLKWVRLHLGKCPALRASVRADAFINWRIATGKGMQHDRWDDLRSLHRRVLRRHLRDLRRGDAALRAACDEIKPGADVVTLRDFAATVGIEYDGP